MDVVVATNEEMWAASLCSSKILQFLTGAAG